MRLDLADLDHVAAAADRLVGSLGGRRLDVVVLNAGVAPARISRSAQGHELAFAVNVLGHHVLLERLRRAGALADGARVVVVTGDILMVARNCSADFASDHPRAGAMAYARSKLGSLWLARELARRHPELHVVAVHPGVVRSGLGGPTEPRLWHRLTQISPERSSETVLAAAFADEVPSGAYVHNTLGLVQLDEGDVAADRDRAAAFVANARRAGRALADAAVERPPRLSRRGGRATRKSSAHNLGRLDGPWAGGPAPAGEFVPIRGRSDQGRGGGDAPRRSVVA